MIVVSLPTIIDNWLA